MKRSIAAAALAAGLLVAPAGAQSYKLDLGVNGGGSLWTPFLSGDISGGQDVRFSTGWLVGAQATFWATPRIGIRANASYEDREVESDGALTFAEGSGADHVNLWGVSGDILIRLREPSRTFEGGEFLPYLALGGGVRYINPAGDRYVVRDLQNAKRWEAAPFTAGSGSPTYGLGELSSGMGLVALGADWRLAPLTALRLEVGDRIQKPRVYQIQPGSGPDVYYAIEGEENRADLNHDIYGTLGLHLTLFGAGRAPVVAVAPPPPPRTEPPPPPPAEPPPPEERPVSVCVIDPAGAGGIRTESAIYLPATRDTMVQRGATRMSLAASVGNVPVMATAEWYVAGSPFMVGTGAAATPFLATGRAARSGGDNLVLLGRANNIPVFGLRSELADGAPAFAAVTPTTDLNTLLANDAAARAAFEQVRTLHLPYEAVGCSFQPMERQLEVRKK